MLLDTGAQVSLTRTSLAEELRLKGKEVTTAIATVGGDEKEITTKMYRLRSLENQVASTIAAVGIPQISDDLSYVNIDKAAEVLRLPTEKPRTKNGTIDLLIGVGHAKLHTGQIREVDKLVARHSALGWVIFGTTPDKKDAVSQVFLVKGTTAVDMSDFWSTESMGVSVKSCVCENSKM